MNKSEIIFDKSFFKIVIGFLAVIALILFLCGIFLNESYFLKFSLDKKLKESTLDKINLLKITFLFTSTIIFFFILISLYNHSYIRGFIRKHKKLFQNAILLFLTLLIIFIFSETILRVTMNDQTVGGGFGPGSLKFNQKYVILNDEGMRDRDFTITKPTNTMRIAVLGDSFSFGSGIKNVNLTYPKLLESELNDLNSINNYEVLNFGIQGRNTEDEIKILEEKVLKYSPDLLILGYVFNDIENVDKSVSEYKFMPVIPYFGIWIRNVLYSYMYTELKFNYILDTLGLKKNVVKATLDQYNSEINKEYNNELFKKLRGIAEKNDIRVVVVIFPGLIDFNNYPYNGVHEYLTETSSNNGFYVIDLFDTYKSHSPESLQVNEYDSHPNELGHRLAAEKILEKLIQGRIISLQN